MEMYLKSLWGIKGYVCSFSQQANAIFFQRMSYVTYFLCHLGFKSGLMYYVYSDTAAVLQRCCHIVSK